MSFSGLCNDNVEETFNLKHELHGKMFPCSFIKIGKWPLEALSQTLSCFLQIILKGKTFCIIQLGLLILCRKSGKLCNVFIANCAKRRVYYEIFF